MKGSTGAVGVLNALLGSGLSASSLCCQKWAHLHPEKGVYYRQKIWRIGCLLIVVGGLSSVVNFALLGQAAQAPFAATTLIFNALLSKFFLGESISRVDLIAGFLIIAGVATSLMFAYYGDTNYELSELLSLYANRLALVYSVCVIGYLLAILFAVKVVLSPSSKYRPPLRLLLFGTGAGIQAGFSGLLIKSCIEIVSSSIANSCGDMRSPLTYLFAIMAVGSLLFQLFMINRGLSYFNALQYVPIYQACIVLANLCCGLFFFREYERYSSSHLAGFVAGCIITAAGVLVLVLKVGIKGGNEETEDLESKLSKLTTLMKQRSRSSSLADKDSLVTNVNFDDQHASQQGQDKVC